MNVIKWILIVFLVLVFICGLIDSLSKQDIKQRVIDLVVAIMCFVGITVIKMFWW